MGDDWILGISADGGIDLRRGGGTGGTEFPPIIIIRGWQAIGAARAGGGTDRYFVHAGADGVADDAASNHYILGGDETDLPSSAVADAVPARLTSYDPETGTFRARLDDRPGS